MAAPATVTTTKDDHCNNDLFGRLPFLADALLPLLDSSAVLQLSSTCQSWRRAVQLCQLALAPKSELSMPFVAGCLQLRHLQLSHMRPAHKGMAMQHHQQLLQGFVFSSQSQSVVGAARVPTQPAVAYAPADAVRLRPNPGLLQQRTHSLPELQQHNKWLCDFLQDVFPSISCHTWPISPASHIWTWPAASQQLGGARLLR
jgi:hypothetical protein